MPHPYQPRNLLAGQSSPYLIQHADNPVHWRPWGEAALAEAAATGKPILLSIGYAACHWCHVMAHESFENPETAELMNRLFVNIKVDREERPDVDQIYMAALHAMGEQGGWPLTMFLEPDGRPFWGGTYFPPDNRYGRPGFPQVLQAVARAWREDHASTERNAAALQSHLAGLARPPESGLAPTPALFDRFAEALLAIQDPVHGGTRGAPKFPNAPMAETCMRAARGRPDSPAATAFLRSIERMSQGGIYDHLGGGLARYSVDDRWLVPHFEKMLYDNAHYIRCLVWAHQLDAQPLFRQRIEEVVAWLKREMRIDGGGFASSIDADSEGEEGKFYVWSGQEIESALGPDADFFSRHYGVSTAGNFEGANVLNRLDAPPITLADEDRLARLRARLLAIRDKRPRPTLDDKVLADWNGYAIRALAEAGFVFDRPDWTELAAEAFRFISESMTADDALSHSWRAGVHVRPALASDYGAMINAALSLYQSRPDPAYLAAARQWIAVLDRYYADGAGGYFLTSASAADLITRPRGDTDDPNPSPASQILEGLSRLAQLTGDADLLAAAHRLAGNFHAAIRDSRYGNAGFHNAIDSLFAGRHVTLFVDDNNKHEPWLSVLRAVADPALTWDLVSTGAPRTHFGVELAAPANGPAAVICTQSTCSAPLATPAALRAALSRRN